MALGNGNPKEGDKGSNFFWELKVLQGLEAIAEAIEAGGGGGGGGGMTALTGDVTAGPGSGSVIATIGALKVTTPKIADNAVTLGKMQLINNYTFLGNGTGPGAGTGPVAQLSLLNVPYFSGGIGGSATNSTFLRGDGSWQNIGSAEGLSTNATTGNIELGKTSLAATADLTVARFINGGANTINISGEKKLSAAAAVVFTDPTSPATFRAANTAALTGLEKGIGVMGTSSGDSGYGVYGSATGGTGIGVYGANTAGGAGIGVYGFGAQTGVYGNCTNASGAGVLGSAVSATRAGVEGVQSNVAGYAINAIKGAATSGQITPMIKLTTGTSGVGSNNQGSAIHFGCDTVTANNPKNQVHLSSSWIDATTNTATANFTISVANAGATPSANITFSGGGNINIAKTLPTSSVGLAAGDLYTQTATQLGGSGAQKVICIV
jgi:hypothetical protein